MIETAKNVVTSIRPYSHETDYEVAKSWWMSRDNLFVRPEWLSNIGIVVEIGEPVCMTWLYVSNAKIGQIGWTTTKPGLTSRVAYKATYLALRNAVDVARSMGITYLHSMSNKSGLTKIMQRIGFSKKDGYDYLALIGGNNGD